MTTISRTVLATIATAALLASAAVAPANSPGLRLRKVASEPDSDRARPTADDIQKLAQAVTDNPKDRQARFDHVRGLIAAGELEQALDAARNWREVDAYNLVVVRMIGDILTELERHDEALRTYSAVVELLPEDAKAQRALASVLKQQGKLEAAYHRLAAAVALRPEDRRLAFELADVAHRMGRHAEAEERFEGIAASDETPPAIRYPAKQRLAQIYAGHRRSALQSKDAARAAELEQKIVALEIKGGVENDIKVYLTWDTDRSDVDLWVTNPAGEKVFYSHREGQFGGALFDDVTTGYGPESFTAKDAAPGRYLVQVNYYGSQRRSFPEARGEVQIVLNEGRAGEVRHTLPYRLFAVGETVTVAEVTVQGENQ